MQTSILFGGKMSTVIVLIFAMCGMMPNSAAAQFRDNPLPKASVAGRTPISEDDFFRYDPPAPAPQIPGLGEPEPIPRSHKSGFLAGVLSFALPGLGEYYVGDQIWRGIIFTVIDAGLWYERYHYLGRGNDSVTAFQAFSDANFSPKLYSDSLNARLALAQRNFRITDPNDFSQINKAEDTLNILGFQDFGHQLPAKGSQQYYEIISKYIQYRLGWRDYTDQGPNYFSPDYETAAYMRSNMNYQFQVADYFLYGLLLNRVLSAIDAVLLAKDHNTPIHLEGGMQQKQLPDGSYGFIPTAHLRYTF
jgi:hypothetical protein